MKTLLICNSISPVLIGEVTICWCVHEGGNVVSLNGLVILFFCYCCLVLSATVNVNSRDRETIRQNCPLHVVFRLGLIWDTSRLSYPKRLDLSATILRRTSNDANASTRFVYLLTQWKASYATKISKLVCLASSSMPTPKPPPPDAPEALVMRIKMAPSWFLQRRVR